MRQIRKIIVFCSTFLTLVSCGAPSSLSISNSSNINSTTTENSDPSTSSSIHDSSDSSTSSTSNSSIEETIVNFDIYTINDFHGATKYIDEYRPQIGLAKLSTIFNSFALENTSFFISAGDMWQETIESNTNRGAYVTTAMNYIGFDCMTLGNHEFDWGTQYIENNSKLAEFPFLCANLTSLETNERPDYIQPSTILEKNGIKVGVIGTIGPSQYNDISHQYVYNYKFDLEYSYIVNEANYLRSQGVDIVVLSTHDSYVSDEFTVSKKQTINDAKIDAVISAHSHKGQNDTYTRSDNQKVPIIQAYSRGIDYGHLNFTYNRITKELTNNINEVNDFRLYKDAKEDERIVNLYNELYNVDDLIGEEVCEISGSMDSYREVPNLAASIMHERVKKEFNEYNVLCSIHNQARSSIESGILTYEHLFKALPFDNEIIIFQTNQNYLDRMISYQSRFFNKDFDKNSTNFGTFYVASIDYVAYKEVDIDSGIRTGLFIRDIVKEYMQEKRIITASDYSY